MESLVSIIGCHTQILHTLSKTGHIIAVSCLGACCWTQQFLIHFLFCFAGIQTPLLLDNVNQRIFSLSLFPRNLPDVAVKRRQTVPQFAKHPQKLLIPRQQLVSWAYSCIVVLTVVPNTPLYFHHLPLLPYICRHRFWPASKKVGELFPMAWIILIKNKIGSNAKLTFNIVHSYGWVIPHDGIKESR